MIGKGRVERNFGIEGDFADKRVGAIHRTDLAKAAFGVFAALYDHHGTEIYGFRDFGGYGIEPREFIFTCKAVGEFDLGVATKKGRTFFL